MMKHIPTLKPEKMATNQRPSNEVIKSILNYSKSIEVKSIQKKKLLIHLN